MKYKKIIWIFIGLILLVGFIYLRNWQTGEWAINFGKPIDNKYVYALRENKFIDVKCVRALSDTKFLVSDIKAGNTDSTNYNEHFFFFSSIREKVDIYKYFEVDGINFALIGFNRHHPRMGKRASGFVQASYLFDTVPEYLFKD